MIIIGVITIAVIVTGRNGGLSYSAFTGQTLQANSYIQTTTPALVTGTQYSSGVYIPNLQTNYPVSAFRTSNTSTITTTSTTPSTNTYYYTTTSTGQDYTNYNNAQGYVPAGCESGTDYSLTTGEPCG